MHSNQTPSRTWSQVHDLALAASRRLTTTEHFVMRHPEGGFQFTTARPESDSDIISSYTNGHFRSYTSL